MRRASSPLGRLCGSQARRALAFLAAPPRQWHNLRSLPRPTCVPLLDAGTCEFSFTIKRGNEKGGAPSFRHVEIKANLHSDATLCRIMTISMASAHLNPCFAAGASGLASQCGPRTLR